MFNGIEHQWTVLPRLYMNREGEPINQFSSKGKPWNGKLIGRLLLIVTVLDPEGFTLKRKPVTYIGAFVELYNWKNGGQVHKIHRMMKLEKMRVLTAENPRNFNIYRIIEILLVPRSTHVVPKDQNKFVFYINNYID